MFMRLVQIRVKEGFLPAVTRLYSRVISPGLATVPGCEYAGLLQRAHHSDECLSLTIWESAEQAIVYERSGLFTTLVDQLQPFLAESTELRLQLSADLKLEYLPVPGAPVISSYPVAAAGVSSPGAEQRSRALWVRVVSLKIRPGKLEEFKSLYAEKAIPALRALKGCVYVYLVEKADPPNEVLSVTGWDSRENADRYERGGMFDHLLDSQQALLSDLYRANRDRENAHPGTIVTSEDVTVDYYSVLVEESFDSPASGTTRPSP
jgi:quinol monooxygenase YgiN